MRKCIIKAEGCFVYFSPRAYNIKSCGNPECLKQHRVLLGKRATKLDNKSYKKPSPSKVYRYCLGVNCLGERKFWSLNGARLCENCRISIKGFNDDTVNLVKFRKS